MLRILNGLHHIIAKFAACAARITACDGQLLLLQHADVKRALEQVRLFLAADVGEEHHGRAQHRAGIRILAAALADHAGGGAMNRLKHGVALADICAACRANTTLEFGSLIRDDIAVEVRQDEHAEVAAALFINELCRKDVDIPFVCGDLRVFFADLFWRC